MIFHTYRAQLTCTGFARITGAKPHAGMRRGGWRLYEALQVHASRIDRTSVWKALLPPVFKRATREASL